jgi:hypothetical protein
MLANSDGSKNKDRPEHSMAEWMPVRLPAKSCIQTELERVTGLQYSVQT